MPITPPDSPSVNTGGASNTECVCIIHTHDRGPKYASTKIDISKYITSVGVAQHLSGGGAADITLPAVDFIEDLIAAGDIVNIYFNTNRGDVDLYNRGRVRVFFGYVESVTRSVSVSGVGAKLTTYNISCKDFSKAVKATEIHHNPHLSHQTEEKKKGVVRKDVRANLGGIALLSKGMPIQGSPRQVIIQTLIRILGFGGQWALPSSYRESLRGTARDLFKKTQEGKQSFANDLQSAKSVVLNDPSEVVRDEFVALLGELAKEAVKSKKTVSDLWDAYVGDPDDISDLSKRVSALANRYRYDNFSFQTAETAKTGKTAFLNNTFFKVRGVSNHKVAKGMGSSVPDVIVTEEEQGLKKDLETVTQRVLQEVQGFDNNIINTFGAFPKANQFAQGFSKETAEKFKTDVVTIFNILCLDYLEPVGGYWPGASNIYFQGSMFSALERASNKTMNELFFDLRPSPLFSPEEKDGLGVPLNGAIPMVPAVVLRQKPFTNYPPPSKVLANRDINGSLVTGAIPASGPKGAYSDQLVVNSGGALGSYGASPVDKSSAEMAAGKIDGQLKKLDSNAGIDPDDNTSILKNLGNPELKLSESRTSLLPGWGYEFKLKRSKLFDLKEPTIPPSKAETKYNTELESLSAKIAKGKKTSNQNIVEMYDKAIVAPAGAGTPTSKVKDLVGLANTDASLAVSKKAVSSVVTLPRPIFRSPDNNRITKELRIHEAQYMLGVQEVKADGTVNNTFSAFSTKRQNLGIDTKGLTGATSFVDPSGNKLESASNPLALLADGSSMYDINNRLSEAEKLKGRGKNLEDYTYHVLDYCTVRSTDCMSESYSRGDFAVKNLVEYWGALPGSRDAQRLFLGTAIPMITPISVYRFGIRVQTSTTEHVQALLPGESDLSRQKDTLLTWVVLQDMWVQHNHEYLGGKISTRGLPGIRPGYRVDRPELKLSFYVDGVNHNWQHPGQLTTRLTVSRGQPSGAENALKYHTASPRSDPATVDRQELGRVFSTSEFKKGGKSVKMNTPGTYTGSKDVGRQIPSTTRDITPKVGDSKKGK